MIRRALLIGVPQSRGLRDVLGTKQDVKVLSTFLQSVSGGYWFGRDNSDLAHLEIIESINPSRSEVLRSLSWNQGSDLSVVLFSGHGCVRQRRDGSLYTSLICNDGQEVSLDELTPSASRNLIIVDCCRHIEITEAAPPGSVRLGALLDSFTPLVSPDQARYIYQQSFQNADLGTLVLYGCRVGQSASDRYSFTRALVDFSVRWSEKSFLAKNGILNLHSAYLSAKSWHEQREGNQYPEIAARGVSPYLPNPLNFPISIPKYQ
jgi:hypothetical protein